MGVEFLFQNIINFEIHIFMALLKQVNYKCQQWQLEVSYTYGYTDHHYTEQQCHQSKKYIYASRAFKYQVKAYYLSRTQ